MSILLSWVGTTDLEENGKKGAICDILRDIPIDQLFLLYDSNRYKRVLGNEGFVHNIRLKYPKLYIRAKKVCIQHPNDMANIYAATEQLLHTNRKSKLYINLSSGSGIMTASWILASDRIDTTRYNKPILLESSWQRGTQLLPIPTR